MRGAPAAADGFATVASIEILGARLLSPDLIASRLATSARGPWPWSEPQQFDPTKWDEDLRRIPRVYEAHGFYGATVASSEIDETPRGVRLRVTVVNLLAPRRSRA